MPDVDNLTFFRIVDKLVRDASDIVEIGMLPTAIKAVSDAGLTVQSFPIEGRYGKSRELTAYFNHTKTLQQNFSDKVTAAIKRLHDFYSNDVFGLGQAVKTAINSKGVWYPDKQPAVISPRVDPLTVAISKVWENAGTAKVHEKMNIGDICKVLEGIELGKGLVGLGVLVDKIERGGKEYNPVATTLARETTVLSAYVPTGRSISEYIVSPEVEQQGNKVIDAYNALFAAFGFSVRIPNVTKNNAFGLSKEELPDMDRCVRIFNLESPGQDKEFYHWAVGRKYYELKVIDFWRKEVVTTDMFKQAPQEYNQRRA